MLDGLLTQPRPLDRPLTLIRDGCQHESSFLSCQARPPRMRGHHAERPITGIERYALAW